MTRAVRRIMIVGGPGSGKSWVSRRLGQISGLPVCHMDHIHWLPGWIERVPLEKDMLTHEIHARDHWIFEGGHSRTYRHRAARAELLLWLDLPVSLRLLRVMWRTLRFHGRTRPDLPEGCPEMLGRQTIRFLRFVWRTRETGRQAVRRVIDVPPAHLDIVHLRSRAEIRQFLRGCRGSAQGAGLVPPS